MKDGKFSWSDNPNVLLSLFETAKLALGKPFEIGDKIKFGGKGIDKQVFDIAKHSSTAFGEAVRNGEISVGSIGMQIRTATTKTKVFVTYSDRALAPRMAAVQAGFMTFNTAIELLANNKG